MANRSKGFGMSAECQRKKDAKFDEDLTKEVLTWMALVLADGKHDDTKVAAMSKMDGLQQHHIKDLLKDGQLLCKLLNTIAPGTIKKINTMSSAFKQMENINNFISGCVTIECKPGDLFQTVDCYEGTNIPQVINAIIALGRKAQKIGYDGPELGPAEATENKREFTEEQLKQGEGIISLQAGTNKFATQAGQNFGKTRAVMD